MAQNDLFLQWLSEEQAAYIHGWDFSHIQDRYEECQSLPWDYGQAVHDLLRPTHRILDMDTGGGEFLLSLGHPHSLTAATEGYPPNIALCRKVLLPLGIDFRGADGGGPLPFPDESFDLVLNRHGDYLPSEILRVLKPGGIFLTQQVGAENDRDLVELLLNPAPPLPFPEQYLDIARKKLEFLGLRILKAQESFQPIRFRDTGALVWFARIIAWEFPGFSVEACREQLLNAQALLERDGVIQGTAHRYFLVAEKVG